MIHNPLQSGTTTESIRTQELQTVRPFDEKDIADLVAYKKQFALSDLQIVPNVVQ